MHISPKSPFLAAAFLAISTQGLAAAPRVLTSLIQPPGGLDCKRAAEQAQVIFDFQQPRSDIKQLSVFVNGKGLKEDAISQDWPRLTVKSGLHLGRNTVEAVATGADGKAVSHKLTVLVGEGPKAGERDSAIVDCIGARGLAHADSDDSWGEEIDEAMDDDDVEYVEDEVEYVYGYAPRYVYRPYPVFSFIVYQPAYYYPYPYYSYYYSRPYRYDRYYGDRYSRGYAWRTDRRGNSYREERRGDQGHSYRPNRPPTHQQQDRSPPPARSESQRTERGRGWR